MKPYKDPDEFIKALGAEEYQKRIDEAENSFMFEIRILQQKHDMKDPESKTPYYKEVAKKLLTFTEELERNNYIEAVAEKYQIGYENLKKLVEHFGTAEGMRRERVPLKSGKNEQKHKKEDGMLQSQKLLLTWLIEYENLYDRIKGIITPEDFTEELYQKTARMLYEQKEQHQVNPALIISHFEDEEEQRQVAELFHAGIRELETPAERNKALMETLLRVKQNSISHRMASLDPTDIAGYQRVLEDRKLLESIGKMNISID